jgi:hypothetical protein
MKELRNQEDNPRGRFTCFGIAKATCAAINKAIKYNSSKILAASIETADIISCNRFSHAGTGIQFRKPYVLASSMNDELHTPARMAKVAANAARKKHAAKLEPAAVTDFDCVFDWWYTLDIANPCIFLTPEAFHAYVFTGDWQMYRDFAGLQNAVIK